MPFEFTEAQEMFKKEVRNFAQKEIAPGAKERAEQEWFSKESTEMWQKMVDMGLAGLNIPEEYGGQPADWVSVGIAIEELSKADWSAGGAPFIGHIPYGIFADREDLRKEWIPAVIKREKTLCFSVTEPNAGSDVSSIEMKAKKDGDHYILNGEKTSVSMGMYADAALVFAKTDSTAGFQGISCFLVPLNLPGITKSSFEDMGFKGVGRASIIFDDVRVPADANVVPGDKGFLRIMTGFDFYRVVLSMQCLAAAGASLDEAIEYAKQRTAFGKQIGRFQGVAFKLAEDATLLETGRLMCYRTLWLRDKGERHTKETAMCKWWCPQISLRIINDAMVTFGHVAYSEEYPLERRYRDVVGFQIADGTPEIQKLIISRELFGREITPGF